MYGLKFWLMTTKVEQWLLRWKRKIFRKIFRAVRDQNGWRIRTNVELQGLFDQPDIVKIMQERIRWAGHDQRLSETHTLRSLKEEGGEEDPGNYGLMMLRKTLERWELDAGEG
ncbi:hypothetical protein C0J52_27923 [Blattella germanica]|nr:hypothetical protein C0J52_27923 [Blattella germanica]